MARFSLWFSLCLCSLVTVLSSPLSRQGDHISLPDTRITELLIQNANLSTVDTVLDANHLPQNITALIGNTAWDPRIICFSNPRRYPFEEPHKTIVHADYLQALAKINDMPDVNVKRKWARNKFTLWEYNHAVIALRIRNEEPTTEDTRFAPAFVALCARLVASKCFTTTVMLGGIARFGPDERFWVMVDGEGEGAQGSIAIS